MANFKILKKKDLRYVFKVFGNEAQKQPAVCVFKRFPRKSETFYSGSMESVMGNVDINTKALKDNKEAEEKRIAESITKTIMSNFDKLEIDYKRFVEECIDRFENFGIAGSDTHINTVNEFLALPEEAWRQIAIDCMSYARTNDEFEMGN